MTVAELILELQKYDGALPVYATDSEYGDIPLTPGATKEEKGDEFSPRRVTIIGGE